MQQSNVKISIIIVHYNVKKELFECIQSIYDSNPKVSYEILVVDHDEEKVIEKELSKKFPEVVYIKNKNVGWGGGVNAGFTYACGEYIYFLNPDTIIVDDAIDKLYSFITKNQRVGIASSMLLDTNRKSYELQGTRFLNPFNAIIVFSFLNKFFPWNPVSKSFWLREWDKKEAKIVEIAPLSAALVPKHVFEKVGGFDEKFFLYFEEYDFGRKIAKLGYTSFIVPQSKVVHIWEVSTKKTGKMNIFIQKSRQYYFEKYYGVIIALLVEFFVSIGKKRLFILSFLLILILYILNALL